MAAFKRIYFDSNVLIAANWPRISAALENVLVFASFAKVDVFLPRAVEIELEEHWIRDFKDKCERIRSAASGLDRYGAAIISKKVNVSLPDQADTLNDYRKAVSAVKEKWKINTIPLTTKPVNEFFEMSARCQSPFKQKDVGFRDAVIYFSVIDHLRQNPQNPGAFVTEDSVFSADELAALTTAQGAKLAIHVGLSQAHEALVEQLTSVLRSTWKADRNRAESKLSGRLSDIESFISGNLEFSQFDLGIYGRLVSITGLKVLRITDVRTPLPIQRKAGEAVKISFNVDLELKIIEERFPATTSRPIKVGEHAPDPLIEAIFSSQQGPIREEHVLRKVVEVEAATSPDDTEYNDVRFVSVRLSGSQLRDALLGQG